MRMPRPCPRIEAAPAALREVVQQEGRPHGEAPGQALDTLGRLRAGERDAVAGAHCGGLQLRQTADA